MLDFLKRRKVKNVENLIEVESIVVFCQEKQNFSMCFRKKGTAINFKCPLCDKYVPNGMHIGCYFR